MNSRYDPLRDWLLKAEGDEVRLALAQIERIIGRYLPRSAYARHYWLNGTKGPMQAWRAAGWHAARFDRATHTVTFQRGPSPHGPLWGRRE